MLLVIREIVIRNILLKCNFTKSILQSAEIKSNRAIVNSSNNPPFEFL